MTLQWDAFAALDGSPQRNFDLLCRGLVQRNYGRYGQLRSRRQQPGVEFFLTLHTDCDLGAAGQCFGWQCKWYDLPADHSLRADQKDDIADSIVKAKRYVDGLTDFVLCLRELPRKADLDWYFRLDDEITLHLWADEEIETRLTGPAEVLRQTYFGELVLTPDQLATAHGRAIAPVKHRWVPDLNVQTFVETALQQALARPRSGENLRAQANELHVLSHEMRLGIDSLVADVHALAETLLEDTDRIASLLTAIADAADDRRPESVMELLREDSNPSISVTDVRTVARRMRALRVRASVAASAIEEELRVAVAMLGGLRSLCTARLVAVVGSAGRGKTQLAAQVTARAGLGLPGVFIRGSELRTGANLDDLAEGVPGLNVATFDQLLEATNAAAERHGSRLPIVIDGLNEAERPAEWRALLEQVVPILENYPHALLVLTLRGEARDALPLNEVLPLELEWQTIEVEEAVARYFDFYLIDPGSAKLPMRLFADPLLLRMYCEATNGDREARVGVEALPTSLVAVFELYRDRTASGLTSRPGHPTLPPGHVERQLAALAGELWARGSRDLPYDDAKELLDEDGVTWDDSLYRALEEEGVIFRDDSTGWGFERTAILFDRFAGYLIADSIVRELTATNADEVLSSAELWDRLAGDEPHPLAGDILVALVALVPRRLFGRQLWQLAPVEHQSWALAQTLFLESRFLDLSTVEALAVLVAGWGPPRRRKHPFDRLWELRDGVQHQLNARFLDRILGSMAVAERDLCWSEWSRQNADELLDDITEVESRWLDADDRDDADDLHALALSWLLTSTNLTLRDVATRALTRYGAASPGRLFLLADDLLDADDPYVCERVLAAAYGAATAHQMPDPGGTFERALGAWLQVLARRYLGPAAESPTSHKLAREYISGCFQLAAQLHPSALPEGIDPLALELAEGPEIEPIEAEDSRAAESDQTFGMDFENYVIGPLHEGRGNYQSSHPGYIASLADVRGRVWQLGWRSNDFGKIDRQIRDDQWRRHERQDRVERYGKKYGWIAYYELAGRLHDRGELRDRMWQPSRGVTPDIDPTFPMQPLEPSLVIPSWVSDQPVTQQDWMTNGLVEVAPDVLTPDAIDGIDGPWILAEGFLRCRDRSLGRKVFGFIRSFLVADADLQAALDLLMSKEYLGNHTIPDCPEDHETFAGEIPWSPVFAAAAVWGESDTEPYHHRLHRAWDDDGIDIELLGHEYAFEGSRTTTTIERSYHVPSHAIASAFDLRERPGTLDLVGLDGRHASLTRRSPAGWDGRLMFLRRDLVAAYAAGRRLVQIAWGEREIDLDWRSTPDWVDDARRQALWRQVQHLDL